MSERLKVGLLSAASSIHTIRWANGLNASGVEVHLISQHPLLAPVDAGVYSHLFPFRGVAGYFTMVPGVRRLLSRIKPDLVNAHYASGYGVTARLVGYHPWLLSVWGSDVYDFPEKSALHRCVVTGNLRAADALASTSNCMADQLRVLARGLPDIAITPFGVEVEKFSPARKASEACDPAENRVQPIVIGTVKALAPAYGIGYLIRAYALVKEHLKARRSTAVDRLRLRIVGDGPDKDYLRELAASLNLGDDVVFAGRVSHAQVPTELAGMDIFVALSERESFGVAAIEAGAAGLPVVVSDAGGLSEVVLDGETGYVVPRKDPEVAARAILKLLDDSALRNRLGENGRMHVATHYSWGICVDKMIEAYRSTINMRGAARESK